MNPPPNGDGAGRPPGKDAAAPPPPRRQAPDGPNAPAETPKSVAPPDEPRRQRHSTRPVFRRRAFHVKPQPRQPRQRTTIPGRDRRRTNPARRYEPTTRTAPVTPSPAAVTPQVHPPLQRRSTYESCLYDAISARDSDKAVGENPEHIKTASRPRTLQQPAPTRHATPTPTAATGKGGGVAASPTARARPFRSQ